MKHSIPVKRRKRGTALTEFAIMVPIMFLLTMGAADFSRMFYTALSVAHSADVSSQYGSQTLGNSVDYLKMRTLGGLDAFETQGTTVTAVHFCVCVAGGAETSCALDTCGGPAAARLCEDNGTQYLYSDWSLSGHFGQDRRDSPCCLQASPVGRRRRCSRS